MGLDVLGQQHLEVAQAHGPQRPPGQAADLYAAGARVGGVGVVFARGVVELLVAGVDEHLVEHRFAVVELGAGDVEGAFDR